MTVYYGSDRPLPCPAIPISEIGREFGIGFYTTPVLDFAKMQAKRKAKQNIAVGGGISPVISAYHFDFDTAQKSCSCKILEAFSEEWLEFVIACYTDIWFVHPYDIVLGSAVTPEISGILSEYRSNKINQSDTLQTLSQCASIMQVCFSTASALSCLTFAGKYD